jgi:hypothetical protein
VRGLRLVTEELERRAFLARSAGSDVPTPEEIALEAWMSYQARHEPMLLCLLAHGASPGAHETDTTKAPLPRHPLAAFVDRVLDERVRPPDGATTNAHAQRLSRIRRQTLDAIGSTSLKMHNQVIKQPQP